MAQCRVHGFYDRVRQEVRHDTDKKSTAFISSEMLFEESAQKPPSHLKKAYRTINYKPHNWESNIEEYRTIEELLGVLLLRSLGTKHKARGPRGPEWYPPMPPSA